MKDDEAVANDDRFQAIARRLTGRDSLRRRGGVLVGTLWHGHPARVGCARITRDPSRRPHFNLLRYSLAAAARGSSPCLRVVVMSSIGDQCLASFPVVVFGRTIDDLKFDRELCRMTAVRGSTLSSIRRRHRIVGTVAQHDLRNRRLSELRTPAETSDSATPGMAVDRFLPPFREDFHPRADDHGLAAPEQCQPAWGSSRPRSPV